MKNDSVSIVFPHQLFRENPCLSVDRKVIIVEDPLFFAQYQFHKKKLIFHRASMKYYEKYLNDKKHDVEYIEHHDNRAVTKHLFASLKKLGCSEVYITDPTDYLLLRRIKRFAEQHKINLQISSNPNFICSTELIQNYFGNKKRFFLTEFYIAERKRNKILLDESGNPLGGKWTYDVENRKKMPAGTKIPPLKKIDDSHYIKEATDYVEKYFASNPGETENFDYAISFELSDIRLKDFIENRLNNYGVYQDAIVKKETFLFHAVLTPMLNVGMLTPQQLVDGAIEYGMNNSLPLNSIEGFVRQVMGWREYIRAVYELKGVKERTQNYWLHQRKIPASFYDGTTGIEPIDTVIKRILRDGYSHHIERLMVLGNFMLLCEFDPDEVYRWFMEMFIDSYDWVMVPNVYGMSQFADGGLMSTKPYISGSNYILKMSDFSKGPWCEIWDALFWRFIGKNKEFFLKNPRLSMMARTYEKMDTTKRNTYHQKAEEFLMSLC